MSLRIVPLHLREANALVERLHRHHRPVRGAKFAVGAARDDEIIGCAITGRPVSRNLDDGMTLEVLRVATDGSKNACSLLYGASWRAARALGYKRLVTYTLPQEGGASLRASGWRCIGQAGGGRWSRTSRPRVDLHPQQTKLRWEMS